MRHLFFLIMTLKVYSISVMKNDVRKFTIDEMCALVEMDRRTVRYYIQKGLVDRPEGVGKGAYYTHAHLEQLLAIRKWKRAGVSLDRIQEILADGKGGAPGGQPLPPPPPRKKGAVEVWSHLNVSDGIELHIEPTRAGLSPGQVRALFRDVMKVAGKIREEKS